VAIFKVVKFGKLPLLALGRFENSSPVRPEIEQEIEVEDDENRLVKRKAEKTTKVEIRSVEDIAEALAEIQQIVTTRRNALTQEERQRIAAILQDISKQEDIFKNSLNTLQKLFLRIDAVDAKQIRELRERMGRVDEKERQMVKKEIVEGEVKLKIEKAILEFERKLGNYLNSFNQSILEAVEHIRGSMYPYDANAPLS